MSDLVTSRVGDADVDGVLFFCQVRYALHLLKFLENLGREVASVSHNTQPQAFSVLTLVECFWALDNVTKYGVDFAAGTPEILN